MTPPVGRLLPPVQKLLSGKPKVRFNNAFAGLPSRFLQLIDLLLQIAHGSEVVFRSCLPKPVYQVALFVIQGFETFPATFSSFAGVSFR